MVSRMTKAILSMTRLCLRDPGEGRDELSMAQQWSCKQREEGGKMCEV